jgi:hypothetical protein
MLHYLILDQKLSHRRMDDDEWKDHDAQEGVHWAILMNIHNCQFMSKKGEMSILWHICLYYWPSSTCIQENMFCRSQVWIQVENIPKYAKRKA